MLQSRSIDSGHSGIRGQNQGSAYLRSIVVGARRPPSTTRRAVHVKSRQPTFRGGWTLDGVTGPGTSGVLSVLLLSISQKGKSKTNPGSRGLRCREAAASADATRRKRERDLGMRVPTRPKQCIGLLWLLSALFFFPVPGQQFRERYDQRSCPGVVPIRTNNQQCVRACRHAGPWVVPSGRKTRSNTRSNIANPGRRGRV